MFGLCKNKKRWKNRRDYVKEGLSRIGKHEKEKTIEI
jgi:hypothetical protein